MQIPDGPVPRIEVVQSHCLYKMILFEVAVLHAQSPPSPELLPLPGTPFPILRKKRKYNLQEARRLRTVSFCQDFHALTA